MVWYGLLRVDLLSTKRSTVVLYVAGVLCLVGEKTVARFTPCVWRAFLVFGVGWDNVQSSINYGTYWGVGGIDR